MSFANHNVLQFVSAAAQVVETQEGDDIKGSASDLRHSTDGLFTHNTWDIPERLDDQHEEQQQKVIFYKPEQTRQLLAEAAGEEPIVNPASASKLKSSEIVQTVEEKLKSIFSLPNNEVLKGEWPCYIVQSAITSCNKSGYLLLKKSSKNHYERYYFDIKQDVLAWFESSTDSYSPLGKIDLKDALAVRQSTKRKYGLRIITMIKTWHLQADTSAALVEWTNALQKAIFRAKNNGTSLKIKLPFKKILDIEQTEAFEFQKFLLIRAAELDDSFAMDEFYFAYFSDIEHTFNCLKSAWEIRSHDPQFSVLTHDEANSDNNSPSLSISDLYDTNSQPITIQPKRSVVANALAVPAVLKDILYPSTSSSKSTVKSSASIKEDTSSSEDDEQTVGWLQGKSRTGMKLVYGLLGANTMSGSPSTALDLFGEEVEDEEEEDDNNNENKRIRPPTRPDESEVLDDRTMTNFRKYFVLAETEKLLTETQTEHPDKAEQSIKDWENRLLEDEINDSIGRVIPTTGNLPIYSRVASEPIVYKTPEKSLHFTCITIGTRGDVQPYIALCKGLMKEGHRCRIATHDEFQGWIEEHGIEFRTVGGDPGELMRICVENNFFSVNFVVEGLRLFKDWIGDLLTFSWKAVQGTDVILESPSAMIGVHMAEALRVPYFRSFPMPMTRTRSFPHPFATPNNPKGRLYNDMTYVLFDHAIWRAIATRTNSFRQSVLGLPATTYEKLEVHNIPYLYSFSPSIVPSPLDWQDWIHCTGYWFLDNPQTGWKPDPELKAFIDAPDNRPIVYIGFGSIIVSDPQEITRVIIESVLLSNVRAIVSQGWSSRLATGEQGDDMLKKHPGTILSVQSVPHDWLFPKIRVVVHHGGAGTTAAGLRAGRPTIIKPFFADQFFWGERVQELGLGRCIKSLTVDQLSAALRVVSTDENMLIAANKVGQKIRDETGVETAIKCIYRDMELAEARTISSIERTIGEDALSGSFAEEDQDWTLIDDAASGSISPGSWKPKDA
ncbi:hypothetical protein HPULCUR_006019 [Helicostylum pulchrum]|uniref:PH domain-containing protein n=1 Tax=Helicostylum pulchrum TaxID=562976 RepID=A0ABP9Y1E6_9FUNG